MHILCGIFLQGTVEKMFWKKKKRMLTWGFRRFLQKMAKEFTHLAAKVYKVKLSSPRIYVVNFTLNFFKMEGILT